jgi:DNA-binding response OmpR family regulator
MRKMSVKTVLLVEDNPGDAHLLREMFNEQDWRSTELMRVECMSAAEAYLAEHVVDIILLDLGLPDARGLEAIRRAHAAAPGVPLVVLTGLEDESLAVQALQLGAQDYLMKGQIEARGLLRALRYAVERKTMERAALSMSRQMARSPGEAAHEKSCGAVLGFGRLQTHQRFPWTSNRRQAASIRRQALGGLHPRLGLGEPAGRR